MMKKGYLTVYLSLSLGIILSLILALTEWARINAMRMQIECTADTAATSVLAEYHRQLLEQYELFYVDTSYGDAAPAYSNTEAHLRDYMEYNFSLKGLDTIRNYRDMLKLSVGKVALLSVSVATDENGIGIKRQAVLYEKDRIGLSLADEIMRNLQEITEYETESGRLQEQRKEIEEELNELIDQAQENMPSETQTVETENGLEEIEVKPQITRDNPADIVNATRGFSVLKLVVKDMDKLSRQKITPSNYVTGRTLHTGTGKQEGVDYPQGLIDNILFHEYILDKCSRYTDVLDKSLLKYQTEYIIGGKDNDEENLKSIVYRLLLIREAANAIYLLSDSAKMAEIETVSSILSLVCMVPEIEPLVRYSILFAWAYVESVQDVRNLLDKKRVPLMKNESTWNTKLFHMTEYQKYLADGDSEGEGMSYEDYLRVFLCMTDETKVTMRLADVMEMDIRRTAGNENFRLDGCIESFEFIAYINSGYGYDFNIQRNYSYIFHD